MSDNIQKGVVLALGYFDSVHRGHQAVIGTAKETAEKFNASTVVVTFQGNLRAVLGDGTDKIVFNLSERERFIKALGVDVIFFLPVNREFLSMDKFAFLDYLNKKYNVLSYVSGEDYKFGKFGNGNVGDLTRYASEKGQTCITVPTLLSGENRISTTAIKGCLKAGDVKQVNCLLGRPYSITGTVFADRKVGSSIGFPTVNLKIDKDKFRLKDGVYAGRTTLYGKEYRAIINYGARPTFDLNEKLVEAHIVDFSGVLYGKEITLLFDGFMRDIIKFESVDGLKAQLEEDLIRVKDYV